MSNSFAAGLFRGAYDFMSVALGNLRSMMNDYQRALEILSPVGDEIYPILTRRYLGVSRGIMLTDHPPNYPPSASPRFKNNLSKIVFRVIPDPELDKITEPQPIDWWEFSHWAIFISVAVLFFSPLFIPGLSSLPVSLIGWLFLVTVIGGGLAYVISVLVLNGTRDRRVKMAREAAIRDVERRRARLAERLSETMFEQWAAFTADWLAVPDRLRSQFLREFVARKDEPASLWADRIREYQIAPRFPIAPPRSTGRLSHETYEKYCARFLQSIGYTSARVTRFNHDGGIDIQSDELVVQCKHYQGSVGVGVVREIFGLASHLGKLGVVITSGSFTKAAEREAARFGVALIHLDERNAALEGLNKCGRDLISARK